MTVGFWLRIFIIKQNFILFLAATEYDEKPDNVKSSLLLHCICKRACEGDNTFDFSASTEI